MAYFHRASFDHAWCWQLLRLPLVSSSNRLVPDTILGMEELLSSSTASDAVINSFKRVHSAKDEAANSVSGFSIVTEANREHPLKALTPTDVTVAGIETRWSPVHPSNVCLPIDRSLVGSSKVGFSETQPSKAPLSTRVTESGSSNLVRRLHPKNA